MGASPRAVLGGRHVVALCVGIVIGAGIFRTPSLVAGMAGSEGVFLLTWLAGGLLSVVGALCYAELASAYPGPGGDYSYLRRAFGPRLAFLYAWARLAVIQTGSVALLAYVCGDYLAQVAPIGPWSPALYAGAVVAVLTAVNWLGVRQGSETQFWLTLLEVGGLVLVVVAGLWVAPAEDAATAAFALPDPGSLGLMMVFVLLTFGGWNEAVYLTAELPDAPRRIARLLIVSLGIVTGLYLLVNYAYLRGLGLEGIGKSDAVAADLLGRAFGPTGTAVISLLVVIAALTSANATVITGARTAWALGRSVHGLRWLGRWDGARDTPGNAVLLQGGIALLLVLAGAFTRDGFTHVVEYTAPVFWLFLLLVGISLFVLRRKDPGRERPFRVPGYPVLPALFCLTSGYLLYSSLAYTGRSAWVGAGVLLAGALLLPLLRPGAPEAEMSEPSR
jgi:amino acid transporter